VKETARRAFVAGLVFGAVLVLALALWKLRILIALLFLAFIGAAAMRPGIEALRRRGVPRGVGLGLDCAALFGLLTLLLWLAVPRALDQVQNALGDLPETRSQIRDEARQSSGVRRRG
jgi:predicted PurR-regulated permease PerM